ncbi:MAG: toll/interleukin-1 receptor domain-containing protein [Erysipelotrichaceae bacterium]|nr:toll/interleukin-1 receptor domain-containing protein [Erysipelotrichaceae bacterium]
MLQVKTYLDKNPNGLLKALYFASEEDFDKYFSDITDQILKLYTNVAFYYSKDPEDITEEVLDSITLAVCPVTLSFLNENCKARDLLFSKILDKHIALLPIMEEEGIDSIYYLVCGKIQYLDAVKKDETALDFEHKLTAFLDNILLDTDTANKIRDAFDAYIFLSYRKKDRKHANEIMRLIHKNEFMRDVAIWYDEYLVPGENYSDAIEDAILKSALVTLVVTPNLVNEENYVKSIEYPLVHSQNKPVLPIEAQDTDPEELKISFSELPYPINIDEPDEISKALLEVFSKEGMKENDDPDHLFFIALAYLYGIDVETDSAKAIELLDRSSLKGNVEASRKLVQLYTEGQFIEADYTKASEILNRLLEQLEAQRTSWQRQDYLDAISYLLDLDRLLVSCEEYYKALPVCKRAYELEEVMDVEYPDEWNELLRGQILVEYAKTLEPLLDRENVGAMIMDYYETAFGIYMDYFDNYGYDRRWDTLGFLRPMSLASNENQFRMGLDAKQGLAAMYFESLGGFAKNEESPDPRFLDLCCSFGHLVNDYCEITTSELDELNDGARERRTEELLDYEKTLKLASILLIRNGRDQDGINLAQEYYRSFGKLYQKMGRYSDAKKMFEMAFSLLFDRYDSPDIIYEQLENARNLINLGDETNDKETLKYAHYELSELLERLYDASGVEDFKVHLEENEKLINQKLG